MDESSSLKISDLYPGLSADELREAEDNVKRYLTVVMRIYERLAAESS